MTSIRSPGDRCVSPLRSNARNKNSFVVHDDFWCDFGSGEAGDAIDLYAALRTNGNLGAAIRDLAKHTGVNTDVDSDAWLSQNLQVGNAVMYWHERLSETPEALDYLHSRNVHDDTISRFRIGYDPTSSRIIVPYFRNGMCYNWIGRSISVDGKPAPDPRYRKLPRDNGGTDPTPWGFHTFPTDDADQHDTLYIAEGTFDALSLAQAFPQASVLATMGGHFPKQTVPTIIGACKQFRRVITTFDTDSAGRKFTADFAELMFKHRVSFQIAAWPSRYKDIADHYAAIGTLDNLILTDGYEYLVSTFESIDDLTSFASKCARFMSKERVKELFLVASKLSKHDAKLLNTAEQTALSCPAESQLVRELVDEHPSLKYIDGVGFYEYVNGVWTQLPDKQVKQYIGLILGNFRTNNRINSVFGVAGNEPGVFTQIEFDRNNVWCFTNGTLELDTGKFRESRMEDYCSIQMAYPYDPDTTCEPWERFIEDITDGDQLRIDLLQEAAGYVLMPHCDYQKIIMLTGGMGQRDGSNGKSIYLKVLGNVFGFANCRSYAPTDFAKPFTTIHMRNALVNLGGDVDPSFVGAEAAIKSLSAGDPQHDSYKGKDQIEFISRAKLFFSYNGALKAKDSSHGLVRRLQIVQLPCQYMDNPDPSKPWQKKKDINIMTKLHGLESGIFSWMYVGHNRLIKNGEFTTTKEQPQFNKDLAERTNPVSVFCEEHEDLFVGSVVKSELYETYEAWCKRNGHVPAASISFFVHLRATIGDKIIGESRPRVNGVPTRMIEFRADEQLPWDENTENDPVPCQIDPGREKVGSEPDQQIELKCP